jgi:multiple antibiotic resistance protein
MIQGRVSGSAGAREGSHQSLAIYPLAFPLIAGPGSFITVILLTDDDRYNFLGQSVTVGVITSVLAIQFAILLAATAISRAIGSAGVSVIGRIMGMLLAATAVGMVLTAIGQWLNLPVL